MTMHPFHAEAQLQQSLNEITSLLDRHRMLEEFTHRREGPRRDLLETMQQRQNRGELHKRLRTMHEADIAYVLESLPVADRQTVWEELELPQAAWVFVELPGGIRTPLA